MSSENVGGGYSPSYAWGCSRLQRVAKEQAERHLFQDAIQELKTTNSALLQEVTELRTSSHERVGVSERVSCAFCKHAVAKSGW
jgi:hypothetical protein